MGEIAKGPPHKWVFAGYVTPFISEANPVMLCLAVCNGITLAGSITVILHEFCKTPHPGLLVHSELGGRRRFSESSRYLVSKVQETGEHVRYDFAPKFNYLTDVDFWKCLWKVERVQEVHGLETCLLVVFSSWASLIATYSIRQFQGVEPSRKYTRMSDFSYVSPLAC